MWKRYSMKDALIVAVIAIGLIWITYPFAVFLGFPYTPFGVAEFDWVGYAWVCLGITIIVVIDFVVFLVRQLKRRKFDVEIREIKQIPYEAFEKEYIGKKINCELEYDKFVIQIIMDKEYHCYVYSDNMMISKRQFSTQEELLDSKIIATQTIKELWNYAYVRRIDGILHNDSKNDDSLLE